MRLIVEAIYHSVPYSSAKSSVIMRMFRCFGIIPKVIVFSGAQRNPQSQRPIGMIIMFELMSMSSAFNDIDRCTIGGMPAIILRIAGIMMVFG